MYSRILTLTAIFAALTFSGLAYRLHAAQDVPKEVMLSGAIWSPSTIPPGNTSTLRVSIATTGSVPTTGIKAILSIYEVQNFGGVSYSITPAQQGEVVLAGGGRASTGEFTLTLDSQNTGRGNLIYRVTLVRLENVPGGVAVKKTDPTTLDATLQVSPISTPSPTPTPTPRPIPEDDVPCYKTWGDKCVSPIVIDTAGNGFDLTDAEHGVDFDINGDGFNERISWTAGNSDDAFLFLDRNEDRVVDNGLELFGNFTAQPYAPVPNGFVALAVYDKPSFGGNADGLIDSRDGVFSQLRLWIDANHNGISEAKELHTLPELGIEAIALDCREAAQRDRYGNRFRYRAKVYGVNHKDTGRWAYDVFLTVSAP